MDSEVAMRSVVMFILIAIPGLAFGEGRCPPGQYPVGGQGVGGCAPIPGSDGRSGESAAPRPTGKWETRWGAIAEDNSPEIKGNIPTGAAVSQKSKGAASALALSRCAERGGRKCKVKLTYYNQCVAMADPVGNRLPGAINVMSRAETVEMARSNALQRCRGAGAQQCEVVYSACSMSEFKPFN